MLEFMGDQKQVREKILSSGMSERELVQRIKDKKGEFAGLLNEKAALYMIAKEIGLEVEPIARAELLFSGLAELADGQKDVNVNCLVERIYPLRPFERNGKKGSVLNVQVSDESGVGKLVLWNGDAERNAGNLEKGDRLKITGAYAKLGLGGVEVHLSMTGKLEKLGKERVHAASKVSDLKDGVEADLLLRVLGIGESKEFEKNGKRGSLCWITAGDESGVLRVVFWDSQAKIAEGLKINDVLKIESGKPKLRPDGAMEFHAGWAARVIRNPEGVEAAGRKDVLETPLIQINKLEIWKRSEIYGTLLELRNPEDLYLCGNCGANSLADEKKCKGCGGSVKRISVIRGLVGDESGVTEATFAGTAFLELLKLKHLAEDIAAKTIVELKKEKLEGGRAHFIGKLSENKKSGENEFSVEKVMWSN